MTAQLLDRAVLVRLTPEQYVEKVAVDHLSRRDFLVLRAIARRAHWQSWRWGEGSIRCVENIARDVRYCERSVQYAYRSLAESGWLQIDPRPGRTNHFKVLRPVEPLSLVVDEEAEPGENIGDNRPPDDGATPASVAPGGAKVAPDLGTPTSETPPVAPQQAREDFDAAGAATQAPPQWRRGGPDPPPATAPPSPAGVEARLHRQDAGRQRALAAAPPPREAVAAVLGSALGEPRGDPPVEHASRALTRQLRPCPRCGASAGEACRRRNGDLRRANHADRRPPRL